MKKRKKREELTPGAQSLLALFEDMQLVAIEAGKPCTKTIRLTNGVICVRVLPIVGRPHVEYEKIAENN